MRFLPLLGGLLLLAFTSVSCSREAPPPPPLRALIIDGQNNHDVWPKSTFMMKAYLEETGLFSVDIKRTAFTWRGGKWLPAYPLADAPATQDLAEPTADPDFAPNFADYDVVISNFGWQTAPWPDATRAAFEDYMANGGGLVVVHAANNSFPEWPAYNRMIGLGGWGGRNETHGPYLYYNLEDERIADPSPGRGGSHGPQHEFVIELREPHPITAGLPARWLHTMDECYDRLRGPAENVTILATAFSSPEQKGTNRHEPMLMTINYEQGRVFHTTLGHDDYSFACVGFTTTFQRGAEWAATGKVTQTVPANFPDATTTSSREF
ncbi:ThuA domain-containing protein [Actomonas aquatica]|uniref:ThuA domain-containing protein n=1 Tax=Actomonas aquatica TaxID=2866162 RepID=A0ABZ1CBC8_9BACT|nr:ThuA domain-containing protein [Opitutus sp. WL0086]WRQ88894.1 ThuA domain-containing protein [Opitutus sp. WL0086]